VTNSTKMKNIMLREMHNVPYVGHLGYRKWEVVTIDFITKLAITMKQHDFITVVVEILTKVAHFIPVKTTHNAKNIAYIYMNEVTMLHSMPKTIVLDKYSKFTSKFWQSFFKGFETNLNISTMYQPESDGKTKRNNMIIEDMLRIYDGSTIKNGRKYPLSGVFL
jgi:hypothetical protein